MRWLSCLELGRCAGIATLPSINYVYGCRAETRPLSIGFGSREWNVLSGVVGAMASEALITCVLSTWSGYGVYGIYGVFGPDLLLLQ